MVVVAAFGTLANTVNAGLVAYFKPTGCTALTIADAIPLFSKITVYEQEYVIGEMKIWDSGSESSEPNNCAMVRVIVYNDGWICAWFDKETEPQLEPMGTSWVNAQTINIGAVGNYDKQYNGMLVEVTNSTPNDTECPDGTVFCIRNFDWTSHYLQVYEDRTDNAYHFNTGHTYDLTIRQSNGNLIWWGHDSNNIDSPSNLSNRLYRTIYEMYEYLRYSSNSTDTEGVAISKAFLDDGGSFIDYTTEFGSAAANDCPLMPAVEEVDDAFYFGKTNKFKGLNLNIGTAGVGNTIVWEYWDGSAWSSLTVTDTTTGFTVAGSNTVLFTPPDDWASSFINSSQQYWIRSRVNVAAFTTQPLLTDGYIIIADSLEYSDTNLGMYSFEDTAAKYCLICGISDDFLGTSLQSDDTYFYNTALLGKIIYSHSINYSGGWYTAASGKHHNSCWFTINSKLIDYLYCENSNGFIIKNIESIDTGAGSQNVIYLKLSSNYSSSLTRYSCGNIATILITS